jgi:hypothetical protein
MSLTHCLYGHSGPELSFEKGRVILHAWLAESPSLGENGVSICETKLQNQRCLSVMWSSIVLWCTPLFFTIYTYALCTPAFSSPKSPRALPSASSSSYPLHQAHLFRPPPFQICRFPPFSFPPSLLLPQICEPLSSTAGTFTSMIAKSQP